MAVILIAACSLRINITALGKSGREGVGGGGGWRGGVEAGGEF